MQALVGIFYRYVLLRTLMGFVLHKRSQTDCKSTCCRWGEITHYSFFFPPCLVCFFVVARVGRGAINMAGGAELLHREMAFIPSYFPHSKPSAHHILLPPLLPSDPPWSKVVIMH